MWCRLSGSVGLAHVVVLGNEKGRFQGIHHRLAYRSCLMKAGQRVASIDLDCRQHAFTRYINNRTPGRAHRARSGTPGALLRQAWQHHAVADNETSESSNS